MRTLTSSRRLTSRHKEAGELAYQQPALDPEAHPRLPVVAGSFAGDMERPLPSVIHARNAVTSLPVGGAVRAAASKADSHSPGGTVATEAPGDAPPSSVVANPVS